MNNIGNLLTKEFVYKNAISSNVNYGIAIYNRGEVEYIEQKPSYVEAWIGGLNGSVKEGGGSRRRVTFEIKNNELHWNCTGNPKNHQIFCKHCVALAFTIIDSTQAH